MSVHEASIPRRIAPLAAFLGLSFLISWGAWGTLIAFPAIAPGSPPFGLLHVLGGFGPTIAPFAVMALLDRAGFAAYGRRLRAFAQPLRWYLLALGLSAGYAAASAVLGVPKELRPWYELLLLFPIMVIGGGLEELGWRGYLLDGLLEGDSGAKPERLPVIALAIGIVWALWHLPLFYLPGVSQHGNAFLPFGVGVLGLSLILAVLYEGTRSVPLAVAFHALFNAVYGLGFMAAPGDGRGAWLQGIICLCLGVGTMVGRLALLRARKRRA